MFIGIIESVRIEVRDRDEVEVDKGVIGTEGVDE